MSLGEIRISNDVLHFISTQVQQYLNSDLHQFNWIQFYFFSTAKIIQGKNHCPMN